MRETANTFSGRLPGWLRQHAFLIRMLFTTLLAGCIPLIIISFLLISREKNNMDEAAQQQLHSVASSVASQFDNYVEAATKVNLQMQIDSKLFESAISVSVQNEIEALEVIAYMQTALPFASDYGLYIAGDTNAIYGMTGKFDIGTYARFRVGMEPQKLTETLENSTKSHFVDWNDLGGNMLYVMPIRVGSSASITRTGLYVISATTLNSSLNNLLADRYALAAIYDAGDRLVYQQAGCPISLPRLDAAADAREIQGSDCAAYLVNSSISARKYRVVIYMNKSMYQQNMDNLSSYIGTLAALNILICVLLIFMVVLLNYQSVKRVFQKVRHYDSATYSDKNELQYIMNAFTDQVEEKDRLQLQLYEQHIMMYDHLLENLLEGQSLSEQDMKLLKFDAPFYYVVNVNLQDANNVEAIISNNRSRGSIYAIEMYNDGYLTFICSSETTENASESITLEIRKMLGSDSIRLGISTPCSQVDQLFLANLEAASALENYSPAPGILAGDLLNTDVKLLHEDAQSIAQLTYAMKMGNEYAWEHASELFDKITREMTSLLTQRYACFQIIELYRKASDSVGLTMDIKRLSQILHNGSVQMIQKEFCEMLKEQCENRKNQNARAQDVTCSNILQYLGKNFTDPMFGMNSIADHLGMTIYTASRMLKNMIGINFRKYLNDMRIEYAKGLLLTTDLPINEIAEKSGFTSPSYFISIFRSSENITPSNFRKR